MTFYVDELKSELEAEKERCNEYSAEIKALTRQVNDLKLLAQNGHSQNPSDNENGENGNSAEYSDKKSLNKLRELFENGWEKEVRGSEENDWDDSFKEVFELFRQRFLAYEKNLGEMRTKENYMETQMEKIIADFKKEVNQMEFKLQEKENELNNMKLQV